MTLQGTLDELIATFQRAGLEQPQFEARQLVQECLGLSFAQLISQPERELAAADAAKVKAWGADRATGKPLAFLSGTKGFYKYEFSVEPGVLIPRPETELVVETALRRLDDAPTEAHAADLGCGSGCIGLSLASELSQLKLWSIDQSPKAVAVTTRNAERLGVSERVTIVNGAVESWSPGQHFDLIVANPPYIGTTDDRVDAHVRKFEPAEALFSGEDGLDAIKRWAPWARTHLKMHGLFVCEIGAGQSRSVQNLFRQNGFLDIQVERDLAGHDRVVSAIRAR